MGCSLLTVDPGTSPGLSINTTQHDQSSILYLSDADAAAHTHRKVCRHSVVRRSHSFTVPSEDPVSTELLLSFKYNPQFTYEEWPLMKQCTG